MKTLRDRHPSVCARPFACRCAVAGILAALWTTALGASELQLLKGHVPAPVANLQSIGRLPADQQLRLAVSLPLRNQAALTQLLQDLSDPANPNYHHYLTPVQFTERFGPTPSDYQALTHFAAKNGLRVAETTPNRVLLDLEGAVSDIERAFHVTLRVYNHPTENRTFFAPDSEPSLDLAIPVLHISGLDNYALPHPMFHRRPQPFGLSPQAGSGNNGNYLGNDFRAAYVPGTSLTGAGQVLGLVEFDGYYPSDITQYESIAGLQPVPLQNILMDGFNGSPGGGNVEVALDIEVAIAMAPGLSGIIVYEGFIQEDVLNRIANDNVVRQLSESWGFGGGPSTVVDQIAQQMIAQGQSYFHSTGDSDAYAPGEVDDPNVFANPADSPYITQVGGTTLTTSGPGGSFVSETVWQWGNEGTATSPDFVGSSGGTSSFYAIPSWQAGVNMSTNQGSSSFRNLPDVALTADNVEVVADDGVVMTGIGGTSVASPLWAAFTALCNQQAVDNGQPSVGFINPAIYAICKKSPVLYASAFHDVVTGNDTNAVSTNAFFAFPGYDLCTGWGSPAGTNLINLLVPPTGLIPVLQYATNYLTGGNGNGVVDPDECNDFYIVLTNVGAALATGVRGTLFTTTPGVTIAQATTSYPDIATNSASTNPVSFRISTAPTFVCGTPIDLALSVTSDEVFTPVIMRFRLATGTPLPPVEFDNLNAVEIPSVGAVESPLLVSNILSAITDAKVSLYITYPYDEGLLIQLISPDGTTNTLSNANGGFGENYGLGCAPPSAETTFDDSAPTPIGGGVTPFAGSFAPDQPLSVFIGKSGTNINGIWKLRVSNLFSGFGITGVIQCWSLILTPATCPSGGGECPGADMALTMSVAPDPVVIGEGIIYSIDVVNNGPSGVTNAVVTQLLPASVEFMTASKSQGSFSFNSGIVTFSLGQMPSGASAKMTVNGQANVAGNFPSSATVSSEQPDPDPANNTQTVIDHIQPPTSDLAMSLTATPSAVLVGGNLVFTATVVNNGPSTATGVFVTNVLPSAAAILPNVSLSTGSIVSLSNNVLVCVIGTLTNAQSASIVIPVTFTTQGNWTATATAAGDQYDPVIANNTASLTVGVGAAADLAVSVVGTPNPVVLGSNLTYFVTATNQGPSAASGITLTFTMDPSLVVLSVGTTQGLISQQGNSVLLTLSSLAQGASALVTVKTAPTINGPVQATASITATQPDPNPANNSFTVSSEVAPAFVSIVPAGATLTAESFAPPDGAIDNGETVTVNLRLQNIGNVVNTNLQAILLATNGVAPVAPNSPQVYGVLDPDGYPVGRSFSFTASGSPGASIAAVLQLSDGPNLLTNVSFVFTLPTSFTFSNSTFINILDVSPAQPYPSTITVSGITGTVSKVTATLAGFTHTYPKDVDVLLVSPGNGADTLLLSHAGDQPSGGDLTFDDFAPSTIPQLGQILSGTWQPSAYRPGPVFSNPAPAGPYSANLSAFNDANPNGTWSLFVEDDHAGDVGAISNGWSLTFTSITPVNPVADLGLTVSAPPSPSVLPANLTYSFAITNGGPSTASFAVFTNHLPANVSFVSASASQGYISTNGSSVVGNLGPISAGSTAAVTVVVAPTYAASGQLTFSASVGSLEIDLNPANNVASAVTSLVLPSADLLLTATASPNPAVVGYYFTNTIVVTNLTNTALSTLVTAPLPVNASFVSASSTVGTWITNNGLFTAALGNLSSGAGASINLVLTPIASTPVNDGSLTNLPVTNIVFCTTASLESSLANNGATNVVTVNNPAPNLLAAGAKLLAGGFDGGIQAGDTVTIAFGVTNAGTADTSSNLTATLLSSDGVTPVGVTNLLDGVITHAGPEATNVFQFTASNPQALVAGTPAGAITASILFQDIQPLTNNVLVTNYFTNSFSFNLPQTATLIDGSPITIPDHGPATPYPATILVSGLTGVVSHARVTLSGFAHTWPSDVNVLLVSPAGNSVLLMAHAGFHFSVQGVTLVFDDADTVALPSSTPITSGGYQPTQFPPIDTFPPPAPAPPYGTALAALNGSTPGGVWSLYVLDDKPGDSGIIGGGWSLDLTTVSPLNPNLADVGVTLSAAPSPASAGKPLTYSIVVNNAGPAAATGVVVTDPLPPGLANPSLSSSQGTAVYANGVATFSLGSLAAGASATASLTVLPASLGVITNAVQVVANETDLNPANNSAQVIIGLLGLTLNQVAAGQLELNLYGTPGQIYLLESSPDLMSWSPVSTNTVAGAPIQLPINPQAASHTFYRAVLTP